MNTDEKGDWGITIHDRRGNVIHLDTQGQNINITAPETVTITARNIVMAAEEDIESTAGRHISSVAGGDIHQIAVGDISEESDNRTEVAKEEYTRTAQLSNEVAQKISLFSEKENMTLQSGKTVEVNSAEKSNFF